MTKDLHKDFLSIRVHNHLLWPDRIDDPADIVRHMGAMQWQDVHQALWCIWDRAYGSDIWSVKSALADGRIIRTWPMRGTLHYLAPEDVHRFLSLCASKVLPSFVKRREFLGVTDKDLDKALAIMERSLSGGKVLTRTQMWEVLQDGGVSMQSQRVYHLTCYAGHIWLICFGPPAEKEETFVLLDERVPSPSSLIYEEQLVKLATLYLRSHGPATVDDLAWWSGLGKTICKQAISMIEDQLTHIDLDGKKYYYMSYLDDIRRYEDNQLCLLGWFDEYFLGYKDRSIVADIEHHGSLFTKNGIFFPTILYQGRVVWSWKRTFKKDKVVFHINLLTDLSIPEWLIEEQARRYARFQWYDKIEIEY